MENIYHKVYENEDGGWCVEYTVLSTNTKEIICFDSNEEAINFYMS